MAFFNGDFYGLKVNLYRVAHLPAMASSHCDRNGNTPLSAPVKNRAVSVVKSVFCYRSKDGKKENVFDALEWLAAMCSHVLNKGEQMVRYYGYYSNASLGKRKKADTDCLFLSSCSPRNHPKKYRKKRPKLDQNICSRAIDFNNLSFARNDRFDSTIRYEAPRREGRSRKRPKVSRIPPSLALGDS
jgi:hypothetical protein